MPQLAVAYCCSKAALCKTTKNNS